MTVTTRIGGGSPVGSSASQTIVLQSRRISASTAATALAASTLSIPDDPQYRTIVDLRSVTKVRMLCDIGGSLAAATTLRLQYHPSGDPTVATGDAGWATLAQTAGSHSLSTAFYTAEIAIPAAARVNNCVIRPAYFGGDGVASPSIRLMQVMFYA